MNKLLSIGFAAILAGCCSSPEAACGGKTAAKTTGLTVCHLVSPANIVKPVFAWKMESSRQGAAQSAYRVKVYEGVCPKTRRLVWDSKDVISALSTGVKYAGPTLRGARKHTWEVAVRDEKGIWLKSASGFFETGLAADDWKGSKWIGATDAREATKDEKEKAMCAAPGTDCVVKTLENPRQVVEAYWTVTGLGVFEAYVNGTPVSRRCCKGGVVRDMLKPGFTHAFKTRHSFTYDVTHLMNVAQGAKNTFSAMVSAGWWRDKITGYAGSRSAFRGMLILRHADGTETRMGTDETWLAAVGGPVTRAAIFDGEHYDARVKNCWMKGKTCDKFKPAVVNKEFKGIIVPMEGATIRHRDDLALTPVEVYVWKGVEGANDQQFGKVKVLRKYAPDALIELDAGETLVVDFAQNAAAVPCFKAQAAAGTVLTILPAEMLNDGAGLKSRGNDGPEGAVYRKNLRKLYETGAEVKYTFAGAGEERYRPEFTFFGYRYVSITATGKVMISKLRSIPVTSTPKWAETGRLVTGEKDVNKLVSNVLWGQYSNYLSVPTDCPQRNERLGWCADTQVFCEAASYNADVYGFLAKWMRDMRDTQHDNGSFPGVAPHAQYGSNASEEIGWSDAGIIVPYTMWKQFGDATIVDDNWNAMEKYLALTAKNKFDSPRGNTHQWADWLSFEDYESAGGGLGNRIPAWETKNGKRGPKAETLVYWHYLGGCYWLWDAQMMAEMAEASGRTQAAAKYRAMAAEAKQYLKANFFDKNDGLVLKPYRNNQCAHLFAIKFGLVEGPAREETKQLLVKNIADHGGCLTTGFLGTSILMDTLTYDVGAPDVAYSLLLQHKNPSWLYSVDQGATTIWERWNSYVKATGFGPVGMNSFNHYAYGAVVAWMYGSMAGIREDPKAPGFKHIFLAPVPDKRVGQVSASFNSSYGTIESAWKYGHDGKWSWTFTIPANTTATVTVPGEKPKEYVSGTYTVVK